MSTMPIRDQLNRLDELGMAIPDREQAAHSLRHIGYHRLSSYWRTFQVQSTGGNDQTFLAGVEFGDVIEHYNFDRALRSTLAEALGQIEVSARALWAGHLASAGGDQAHLNPALFSGPEYESKLDALQQNYHRTAELDSRDWSDATIWEITEAMSFSQLSRWYLDISARRTRNAIARHYRMNQIVLPSILFNLAHLRNICAHHGRLWNRNLYTGLRIPNTLAEYCNPEAQEGLYNRMVIIAYLTDIINPDAGWKQRLLRLLDEYPGIPRDQMGFPDDWRRLDFWQTPPPLPTAASPV